MEYSKEELLKMHFHLVRGRVFTLKMHEAVKQGYIRSSFHTPYGEEALGVGITSALRDTDWISGSHRYQVGCLMRMDNYKMICELFGKKDGYKMGSAFDYHWSDFEKARYLMPVATLGSKQPMYTGFAWQLKRQGKDEIVMLFNGDGSMSEGPAYEAYNLAALKKVPVIYVIDNNKWAMTVPLERQCVNPVVSDRAKPFGLPTQVVDGTDVIAVRKATEKAAEMARNFIPNVLEFNTVRWGAHYLGQNDSFRPDREEINDAMINKDPVKNFEKNLKENGVVDDAYIEKAHKDAEEYFDELIKRAIECGYADAEKDIYRKEYIYGTPITGGDI